MHIFKESFDSQLHKAKDLSLLNSNYERILKTHKWFPAFYIYCKTIGI